MASSTRRYTNQVRANDKRSFALTLEKIHHVYALNRVELQGARSPTYAKLNYLREEVRSWKREAWVLIPPRRSSYPQLREGQISQRLRLASTTYPSAPGPSYSLPC